MRTSILIGLALALGIPPGVASAAPVPSPPDAAPTEHAATEPARLPTTTSPHARELLDNLVKKYGDSYQYEIDDESKLVFATNTDRQALEKIRDRLTAHARALHRDLFDKGLQDYLTVAIPMEWKGSAKGWYNPSDNSVIAKGPGVELIHEFTHALHFGDQMARKQMMHQNWIIEGLACLYESSEIVDGHAVPQHNHRLKIIQNVVRGKDCVPFATYVTLDQKQFMKRPGNHYSQGRYMLMYMYEKHLLKKWYDAYTAGFAQDPTGGQAMEQVFGKKLPEIEKDWVEWVLAIPPLAKPATAPAQAE